VTGGSLEPRSAPCDPKSVPVHPDAVTLSLNR